MIYILTSTQTILKADVRPQESKVGDSVAKGLLHLKLKQQLTSESFIEQEGYLGASAIAAYVSLNGLDQRHRYRASVNLVSMQNEAFNFTQGSSSSGLGYALAVFDSWWRLALQKPGRFKYPIFATGEVLTSGQVNPISHLRDKIRSTCDFVNDNKQEISQFYLCYPAQNTDAISDAQRSEVTELGGILVPVDRLQSLLGMLLSDNYDGDPLGRWEPFKGLHSFSYEDSVRFFGRDKDVERLYRDLKATNGVLILNGTSGSGKTSIIKAGLIPRLERENSDQYWTCETFSEIVKTGGVLNYVLEHLVLAWHLESKNITLDDLHCQFEASITDGLVFLKNVIREEPRPCFLAIDQLEEMLVSSTPANEKIAIEFRTVQTIAEAFSSLEILLAIKSESLGHFLDCEILLEPEITSVTSRLAAEDWRSIVQQQAIFSGLSFERKDGNTSLDDVILSEAIRTPDSLSMVGFLLEQLYQKATERGSNTNILEFSDYENLGGLAGVLANRANELLNASEADEGLISEFFELFVGLTSQSIPYLKSVPKVLIEHARPPLQKQIQGFIDANLLVSIGSSEHNPTLRLVSDRLLDKWAELKEWIEQSNEYLLWRNRIEHDFSRWQVERNNTEDNNTEENHYYWMFVFLKQYIKFQNKDWQQRWQAYIDAKIVNAQKLPVDVVEKTVPQVVMANTLRRQFHESLIHNLLLSDLPLTFKGLEFSNINPVLKRYLDKSLRAKVYQYFVILIGVLLVYLWN